MLNRLADTMKGSYYANPVLDVPNVSVELRQAYPEYYGQNICMASWNATIALIILTKIQGRLRLRKLVNLNKRLRTSEGTTEECK